MPARTRQSGAPRENSPRDATQESDEVRLQPVEDLIGPEPLKPVQRLVQRRELVGTDATDLLDRANVLLIKRLDDIAHLATLVGEADADRAAIDARTLMVEEAHLDELLEIVGDVGAEIVAARTQLASSQLLVADIVQEQRLHRVDVGAAPAVEFVLDDIEQAAMKPLHQCQGLEIERPDVLEPTFPISSRLNRLGNGLHGDASLLSLL